jgi:hypothetical protein
MELAENLYNARSFNAHNTNRKAKISMQLFNAADAKESRFEKDLMVWATLSGQLVRGLGIKRCKAMRNSFRYIQKRRRDLYISRCLSSLKTERLQTLG